LSKLVTLPLPVITQSHVSGFSISRLMGDVITAWPNVYASHLADAFQRKAQASLVDELDFMALLRYCVSQPTFVSQLNVQVPANTKRFESEAHEIKLDYIYCEFKPSQWFGFVPAVEVANAATSLERLQKNLVDTVLLELHRNKRLGNQRALVAVQWYQIPKISQHKVKLNILKLLKFTKKVSLNF